MSEAKVQIVSTHVRKSKNASSCFFVFAGCKLTTLTTCKLKADQISKSIDQSIEPIDEPIPIVCLIMKCVFTKKSIILIMDKPQM